MLFSALFILEIIHAVKAWSCVSPIRKVYSRVNFDAVLQFTADITNLPNQYDVRFYDGTTKARVTYDTDKSSTTTALPGTNITGDKDGNVVVTMNNVQQFNAGVYILTSAGVSTKCSCLYILGTPIKPAVIINKKPSEGESVTLTCSSTSTTIPSNHSLSLKYNWKINNSNNPGGTKYTYTSKRNKLTVSNIVKDDANKQFTCTATEDVTDGYTSIRSDTFSFAVYYGPDSARVNVTSPYNLKEGDTLAIECTADCYPGCYFTWSNVTSGSVISASGALLHLNSVDKYMTGNYKCTSKNTDASYMKSTDISVNVFIKERTVVKWFSIGNNVSQSFVTVDEQEVDVTFTCTISGDPAENVRVMFKGDTLKEVRHTNSLVYIRERVTCFDSGIYECKARSVEMEISQRNVTLFVRCSPRPLRKTRENMTSSLDIPITLTFEVLAYPQPGQRGFTWYKERGTEWLQILSNEDFLIFSSGLLTNLTISSVSESDFGQYRVVAENAVGSYHQYFYLSQDPTKSEISKDDCNCCNSLTIGIVLGLISIIALSYAATITIIWKRNISITKSQCTTRSDRDKVNESKMQTAYENVANTSNEERAREYSFHDIGSEAEGGDESNKTQYTELDILSREKNENMYDMIKRE